jgi:hypothetical protein
MTKAQKPSGRVHIETEPLAAISLSGPSTKRASARWGAILVWFMRLVSAVWLVQGLVQWHTIILPGPVNFDALPPTVIGVTIFFAVIDPAAAVGLWLATPWGGVIWLLAVVAQAGLVIFRPELATGGQIILILDLTLIIAYFLLTYRAAIERDIRP